MCVSNYTCFVTGRVSPAETFAKIVFLVQPPSTNGRNSDADQKQKGGSLFLFAVVIRKILFDVLNSFISLHGTASGELLSQKRFCSLLLNVAKPVYSYVGIYEVNSLNSLLT